MWNEEKKKKEKESKENKHPLCVIRLLVSKSTLVKLIRLLVFRKKKRNNLTYS